MVPRNQDVKGLAVCIITGNHSKSSSARSCPGRVTILMGVASVGMSVVRGMIIVAG